MYFADSFQASSATRSGQEALTHLASPIISIPHTSLTEAPGASLTIRDLSHSSWGSLSMLRRLWSFCCSLTQRLPQRKARVLRSRPGYFKVRGKSRLLRLIPWRLLATREAMSAGLILSAVVAASSGMDRTPIGADVKNLAVTLKGNGPDAPPVPEESTMRLEGEVALHLQIALLQSAVDKLDKVPQYSATFTKQERIDGELLDEQVMQMKINHAPHKVFFKVEKGDEGREILFPAASDDPRLIVKLPKLGFRLPALKFDPTSSTPMSEARYPITMAGIKPFADLALELRRKDLRLGNKVQAEVRDNGDFDGRPCYEFTINYADPSVSKDYRKCILKIDRQLMIPVYARNFTWPDKAPGADPNRLDETTLIEFYTFKNIKLDGELGPKAFLVDNPEYHFVKGSG